MTEVDVSFSQRPRAFSAPAATLEYFVAAHTNPFSPRSVADTACVTSPHQPTLVSASPARSPSKLGLGVVATSVFCASSASLPNPRDPRPFAATMFPTYSVAADLSLGVTSPIESTALGTSSSSNHLLHPPLSIQTAQAFLRTLPVAPTSLGKDHVLTTSPMSQRSGDDARTVVSNIALASVKELSKRGPTSELNVSPSKSTSSDHIEDVSVSAEFYKTKYLEAVEQATAEREASRARQIAWEHEQATWAAKETDYQTKLQFAEAHNRMQRENGERTIKSCSDLEGENKTLRRELLGSSEQVEKYKEIAARCGRELKTNINLNKDLQGQLDLYRGNTSIPLLASQPELLVLKKHNDELEESNTKLLNRLAKATKDFAEEKKQLVAEIAILRAAAAARGAAQQ